MAASIAISPRMELGAVRLAGHVDGRTLASAIGQFFDHEALRPGIAVLWDARGIKSLDITPEDIERTVALIARGRPRLGEGRSAVVSGLEDAIAISTLLKVRTADRGREVKVFDEIEPALAFLGATAEEDNPLPDEAWTPVAVR